jgi:hypothetical protein
MDAPRAAQGHFGGRVAHGSLLISIALGLGSIDVPQPDTVALVGTTWRFLKPVKPGMTVHAVWRLGRLRDVTNPRWGLAVWQVELLDQNEERVLEGEVTVLVNRREVAVPVASRSRRRRRGKAPAPLPAPTAESNLPEAAPADTPAPASRRRRTSKSTPPAEGPPPVPIADGTPDVATISAEAAPTTSSSRRRRRRRGGGGGGGSGTPTAGNGAGNGGSAPVAESTPAPAIVPEPSPPSEPPRSQWAAPEPANVDKPVKADKPVEGNAVSRVFGRLRRPRPAAPAAEGTRSPSE